MEVNNSQQPRGKRYKTRKEGEEGRARKPLGEGGGGGGGGGRAGIRAKMFLNVFMLGSLITRCRGSVREPLTPITTSC